MVSTFAVSFVCGLALTSADLFPRAQRSVVIPPRHYLGFEIYPTDDPTVLTKSPQQKSTPFLFSKERDADAENNSLQKDSVDPLGSSSERDSLSVRYPKHSNSYSPYEVPPETSSNEKDTSVLTAGLANFVNNMVVILEKLTQTLKQFNFGSSSNSNLNPSSNSNSVPSWRSSSSSSSNLGLLEKEIKALSTQKVGKRHLRLRIPPDIKSELRSIRYVEPEVTTSVKSSKAHEPKVSKKTVNEPKVSARSVKTELKINSDSEIEVQRLLETVDSSENDLKHGANLDSKKPSSSASLEIGTERRLRMSGGHKDNSKTHPEQHTVPSQTLNDKFQTFSADKFQKEHKGGKKSRGYVYPAVEDQTSANSEEESEDQSAEEKLSKLFEPEIPPHHPDLENNPKTLGVLNASGERFWVPKRPDLKKKEAPKVLESMDDDTWDDNDQPSSAASEKSIQVVRPNPKKNITVQARIRVIAPTTTSDTAVDQEPTLYSISTTPLAMKPPAQDTRFLIPVTDTESTQPSSQLEMWYEHNYLPHLLASGYLFSPPAHLPLTATHRYLAPSITPSMYRTHTIRPHVISSPHDLSIPFSTPRIWPQVQKSWPPPSYSNAFQFSAQPQLINSNYI